MEQAVKYTENMGVFTKMLGKNVEVKPGRRFDRVLVDDTVKYFVDRHSWEIYGAKSSFQYNPRRQYGKLDTAKQFDWASLKPLAGTQIESVWLEREAEIVKNYKPRGRPRKNTVKP